MGNVLAEVHLDAGLAEVRKWDPERAERKADVENWDAVRPFIMNAHLKDTNVRSFVFSRVLRASVHVGQRAKHHHDGKTQAPWLFQSNTLSLKPMMLTSETSSINKIHLSNAWIQNLPTNTSPRPADVPNAPSPRPFRSPPCCEVN